MKLTDFRLKNNNGDVVKLKEITSLSFGIMVDDRFNASTQELFITCKQGNLRFPLDEVSEISFNLGKEKSFIHLESYYFEKEEKNGTI